MTVLTPSKTNTKHDEMVKMHDDPAYFCVKVLDEHFYMPLADVHLRIFRAIFSEHPFINVIVPRKFGKTTIINVGYPIYSICFNKERNIVMCSESASEARSNLRTVKNELVVNEKIHHYFGNLRANKVKDETGKWNEDLARTSSGIWLSSKGTGSQIRGIKQGSVPPTLIIVDDPQSQKSTITSTNIEKTENWFENEVIFARAQKYQKKQGGLGSGKIRLLGTVVHTDCLVKSKMGDKRFKTLFMQAVEGDDDEKHSIWPEMFSIEFLDKERAEYTIDGKERNWLQERMNIAMSQDDRPFRVEDLRYWDREQNGVKPHFDVLHGTNCLILPEKVEAITNGFEKI